MQAQKQKLSQLIGNPKKGLVNSVMVHFCRCSFLFVHLDFFNLQDALCFNLLRFFAEKVSLDAAWAREILGISGS